MCEFSYLYTAISLNKICSSICDSEKQNQKEKNYQTATF